MMSAGQLIASMRPARAHRTQMAGPVRASLS
jgi:hypothetical protein